MWLSAWNNYLSVFTALSPGQLTDAVKNAMLLNALGAEGFRKSTADPILSNPATTSYTDFQSAATRLFSVKGSEIRALRNLLCRRQHSSETVSGFLAELRALAKHTSLARFTFEEKNAEDYIIGALLALGAKSPAIQQRLLREDNITLQNFYNIATTAETAEADQQLLQEGKIGAIKQRGRPPSHFDATRHSSSGSRPRGRSASRGRPPSSVCLRCGRQGRHTDINQCPALKSKRGHFARICQSSKVTELSNNQIATVRFSDAVNVLPQKRLYIRTAARDTSTTDHSTSWNYNLCFVLPSGQVVDIPTTLDTGADTSLVSIATYTSLLSSFPLHSAQPSHQLRWHSNRGNIRCISCARTPWRSHSTPHRLCGPQPHAMYHRQRCHPTVEARS